MQLLIKSGQARRKCIRRRIRRNQHWNPVSTFGLNTMVRRATKDRPEVASEATSPAMSDRIIMAAANAVVTANKLLQL